jgi:hypothetical protein
VWTHAHPGLGDPAGILYEARTRQNKAAALRAMQTSLAGARADAGSAEWSALSRDAYVARLESIAPDVDLLIRGLDAQADALGRYSVEVEQIQELAVALESQRFAAQTNLMTSQRELSTAWFSGSGEDFFTDTTGEKNRSRIEGLITDEQSRLAGLDVQAEELIHRRYAADAACAQGLASEGVLGATAQFTAAAIATATPEALLAKLALLPERDLAVLLATHPDLVKQALGADPAAVQTWWAGLATPGSTELSAAQQALISGAPAIIGTLNGLPALARVAANRLNASTRLAEIDAEVDTLARFRTRSVEAYYERTDKLAELEKERVYLQRTVDGKNQLYLYDRAESRIVEMLGTPSADTRHRVTYVPGTMSNMAMFYDQNVQDFSAWFVKRHPDTVAFVYKDGLFPGDSDGPLGDDVGYLAEKALGTPAGVLDANSADFAEKAGQTLADFETGVALDPLLARAETTAFAHSWGLADVTSAEGHGATYDSVFSLSGAWMPEDWAPNPATTYLDYSYWDILQVAQGAGVVGDGNNPRSSEAFEVGEYYQGPDPLMTRDWSGRMVPDPGVLLDNHNLVATDRGANESVLKDIQKELYK